MISICSGIALVPIQNVKPIRNVDFKLSNKNSKEDLHSHYIYTYCQKSVIDEEKHFFTNGQI